jgi:hypothetical protein
MRLHLIWRVNWAAHILDPLACPPTLGSERETLCRVIRKFEHAFFSGAGREFVFRKEKMSHGPDLRSSFIATVGRWSGRGSRATLWRMGRTPIMVTTAPPRRFHVWWMAVPAGSVGVAILFSLAMLGRISHRTGRPLYALLGNTLSTGSGQILWRENGRIQAWLSVGLPYGVGLTVIALSLAVASRGAKRLTGWLGLVGLWIYGLVCALVLTGAMGTIFIDIVGVFI